MAKHNTVHVKVGNFEADIDEELAPLIEEIWKADIPTVNACQENRNGIAWIEFLTGIDVADFLNVVAGKYSDEINSLYNRIRGEWDDAVTGPAEGKWQFSMRSVDMSVRQWFVDENSIDEEVMGPPEFIFHVSIHFPRTDIPVLLQRMREFNARQKSSVHN